MILSATVDRNALAAELQLCSAAVARKSTIPILQNVLIEFRGAELRLRATDLELTIYTSIAATDNESSGDATIELVPILAFAKSAPGDTVTIAFDGKAATLSSGMAKLKLPTLQAQDFPVDTREQPGGSEVTIGTLALGTLKALIAATSYACSDEQTRFNLAGCLLTPTTSTLELVGTNGSRLGYASTSDVERGNDQESRMLTRRAIAAIPRMPGDDAEPCVITATENGTAVTCGSRVMLVRAVDINFPAWRTSVPASFSHACGVDVATLLAATQRTLMGASDSSSRGIGFSFTEGRMRLSLSDSERSAEEQIPIDYDGSGAVVMLNGRYLVEMLSVIGSGRIRWSFNEETGAAKFEPINSGAEPDDFEQFHLIWTMFEKRLSQ